MAKSTVKAATAAETPITATIMIGKAGGGGQTELVVLLIKVSESSVSNTISSNLLCENHPSTVSSVFNETLTMPRFDLNTE
jgi:hypothetical protein